MEQFDIPVVIFFFKRTEKTVLVVDRLAEVRPKKIYLISDGPRNEAERSVIVECRRKVESKIDWPCVIVKNYADTNKGVYDRIGLGAKWVFDREDSAIFLEDDNLPEITFFRFCKEMLDLYRDDTRILWICGTNYLREYEPEDGSSYVFSKHMMPCGWASWRSKFSRFYDGDLTLWDDSYIKKRILHEYSDRVHCRQDIDNWDREKRRIKSGRPNSWDYQMSFTQRVHGLYAIVPKFNQITNIGVDEHSIHGGTSFDNVMTKRFCGLPARAMDFPLRHPKAVLSDLRYEKLVGEIIVFPVEYRFKGWVNKVLKRLLSIDVDKSLVAELKRMFLKW